MIDPLAKIMGIVLIVGLILDLILFFVSKILNNKELEITAKNNVIEILITLLIFLILWNSIQTIIPEGVCNILNKGILNDNVNCNSNTSRMQYINQTLNKHINYTYFIIGSSTTKDVMNSLIKATSRSVLFRMSFNFIQDPSIKYSQEMVNLINNSDLQNFIQAQDEFGQAYQSMIQNLKNPSFFGTFGFQSCNHLSLIQNKLSSIFAIISQQNSILYSLRSIFEISYILIPMFLFVGIVLRTLKISRGVGGFLISFSIALTLLPYITTFLIEMIPKIDRSLDPNNLLSDFQRYLNGFRVVDYSNCLDLSLTTFKSKIDHVNSDLTSQNSLIVRTTLLFYLTLLSLGLSLLATISITVGINRLLGIEVSPFVLSYIARVS
jgi:hypothetical protein